MAWIERYLSVVGVKVEVLREQGDKSLVEELMDDVVVGMDRSPSTLGAAAITADGPEWLVSDYRGVTYNDRGLGIKLARLQTEGQLLHRKAARLRRLAATAPPEVRAQLDAKIAVLEGHRTAVGAKRGKINREMTFHFARQVTDYATSAGAQVIAVEDLTTLETTTIGPRSPPAATPSTLSPTPPPVSVRCGGGVRTGTRIFRAVSGLQRATLSPRRLPPSMVCGVQGWRKP
ncbi:hypothetical protein ROP_67080 [Rhodococcus opacus B4]|uniref:Uncharacterized protein n=1 Tax=Rhodococcus opacus (strain B4) TaxID=632772 RepID=C1B338_RHOOB|nr:hypothetical protein ROP_67080 [Rhodococcus opacus B4]